MSFEAFTDGKSRDSRYSPYAAIVIDPFTNLESDKLPADGGYPGLLVYYGKSGKLKLNQEVQVPSLKNSI